MNDSQSEDIFNRCQRSGYAAGIRCRRSRGDQHANEEAGHAGEESQSRQIHLTPEQTELLSIQTVAAAKGRAGAIVTAPAEIQYVPDRVAEVGPLLEGKLTGLAVDLGIVSIRGSYWQP